MLHIVPQNDERSHELTTDCWCDPRCEWQDPTDGEVYSKGPIVIHNSSDCREQVERLLGEGMGPDKRWETIEV